MSSFNSLNINLVELSSELRLGHTLTASDIDFTNLIKSYDANSPDGKAITAAFKSNSNSNSYNYGFTLFTDGASYIEPTITKTSKNLYLKYFDLTGGQVTTINNYATTSYTIVDSTGGFINGGGIGSVRPLVNAGCGQATINCMIDLYSNHGWLSVWATIQSAFIPETAVAVAATCTIHNCLN